MHHAVDYEVKKRPKAEEVAPLPPPEMALELPALVFCTIGALTAAIAAWLVWDFQVGLLVWGSLVFLYGLGRWRK